MVLGEAPSNRGQGQQSFKSVFRSPIIIAHYMKPLQHYAPDLVSHGQILLTVSSNGLFSSIMMKMAVTV